MFPRTSVARPRLATLLAAVLLATTVAGCSSSGNRGNIPVSQGSARESPRPSGTYTVQRGDTIYSVSRRFNVPVRALIDANRLQPPFQLNPGQVLSFSTTAEYTVVKGDTLTGVSRKTSVPFATLARMNNLSPPYLLRIGQHLKLPGANAAATAPDDSSARIDAGPQNVTVIHSPLVAPGGGTSSSSAQASASSRPAAAPQTASVAPPPPPAAAADTRTGDEGSVTGTEHSASAAESEETPAPVPAPAPAEQTSPSKNDTPRASASLAAPLPPTPPKSGRGYLWPVKGQVIAEFGPTGKGQHNDGINIRVPKGTPVMAADNGVVAYAGNELRGFGNLLLIKHADGWITAYAHNETLLVKRGDVVKRGQQVAVSGDSGGVSEPQLHFEVRDGTRAIDPLTCLGVKAGPTSSPGGQPGPG